MDALEPQTNFWGSADIASAEPAVTVHHDVVYQPAHPIVIFDQHLDWGIYSAIGQRVDEAAPRRFPSLQILGQSDWKPHPPASASQAPEASYVYGGVVIPHYGHFICTSLSRLWYLLHNDDGRTKVVFHSPKPLRELEPYMRDFLRAAGLAPERIVIFDRPTWIERLIVPAQGFVEQAYAHSIMRSLYWKIGDSLATSAKPLRPSGSPVYLSKTKLGGGVSRLRNEADLQAELELMGVEIVWPETLSTAQQVALFRSERTIMGGAGSGFHTCAFARPAGRRLLLSFEALNTCQLQIDRLCWPDASHLKPLGFDNLEPAGWFGTEHHLHHPAEVALSLMARA